VVVVVVDPGGGTTGTGVGDVVVVCSVVVVVVGVLSSPHPARNAGAATSANTGSTRRNFAVLAIVLHLCLLR